MCGHVTWWWILPLIGFGTMILFFTVFARIGGRSWCSGWGYRSRSRERIQKLEEELQSLRDQSVPKPHPPFTPGS